MLKLKKVLSEINYIFDKKQKKELFFLFVVIVVTTFVELLGVTAIIPLIEVMMNPEVVETTPYLAFIYNVWGFKNVTQFLVFLAIFIIGVYWAKNIAVAMSYNLQHSFTFNNQKKMAYRMLDCYLKQPYYYHLEHSSSELIRSINTDLVMMFQAILAAIQLFAELMVCAILGIYLFITDASITIVIILFMLVFAIFFIKKFKIYLRKIGEEDRYHITEVVKWLQQSFGGLKETKIMHRENFFLSMFEYHYSKWADLEKRYRNMQIIPKPMMESVCITALMLAIVIKLISGTNGAEFVTTISAFAVAAFRLLPSFNRITNYISALMFHVSAFEAVYNDLQRIEQLENSKKENVLKIDEKILELKEKIHIEDLCYKYPTGEEYVLKDVNLIIPKNKSVALIGPSGSGKTTLADLILGALEPTEGTIMIDNQDAFEKLSLWQSNVGYIPQNIYLMDDTIKNNIVYGAETEIDEVRLINAIEKAQLKDFIATLNEGLDTSIGEGGIRLSGGQRQRIGIARALYKDPQVLVLDEATSALDNDTETAIMEAIDSLSGTKTLIIIAHRLSTVENCDLKYMVKDGEVKLVD